MMRKRQQAIAEAVRNEIHVFAKETNGDINYLIDHQDELVDRGIAKSGIMNVTRSERADVKADLSFAIVYWLIDMMQKISEKNGLQ